MNICARSLLSLIFLHFSPLFSLHALDAAKLLDRGKHPVPVLHLCTEEACDKYTEGWKVWGLFLGEIWVISYIIPTENHSLWHFMTGGW